MSDAGHDDRWTDSDDRREKYRAIHEAHCRKHRRYLCDECRERARVRAIHEAHCSNHQCYECRPDGEK